MSQDEVAALIQRWPLINEFKLPPDATVIVVGAYQGLAMEALDDLYHPIRIYGYEPQPWACEAALTRLAGRESCRLFNYGLGDRNTEATMGEWHTDACSFINTGPEARQHSTAWMKETDDVLSRLARIHEGEIGRPLNFDLVMVNIEGFEYVLLPYLRKTGWLDKFDRLAVQFHLNMGFDATTPALLEDIETTHKTVYDIFPEWRYWERK